MHKRVHGRSFKKRAPHAIKAVVEFATKAMGTTDVRIDPKLNQELWSRGIKSVPHRVRVKLERASVLLLFGLNFDHSVQANVTTRRVPRRNSIPMPAMSQ